MTGSQEILLKPNNSRNSSVNTYIFLFKNMKVKTGKKELKELKVGATKERSQG